MTSGSRQRQGCDINGWSFRRVDSVLLESGEDRISVEPDEMPAHDVRDACVSPETVQDLSGRVKLSGHLLAVQQGLGWNVILLH